MDPLILQNCIFAYAMIAAILFVVGMCLFFVSTDENDKKNMARMVLIAPIWPVVLWFGFRLIWDAAELHELKKTKETEKLL